MTSDKFPRPAHKSTKGEMEGFDSLSLEEMQFMLGLINDGKLKLDVPSGLSEEIKTDEND